MLWDSNQNLQGSLAASRQWRVQKRQHRAGCQLSLQGSCWPLKYSLHPANAISGVKLATQGPAEFPLSFLLPVRADGEGKLGPIFPPQGGFLAWDSANWVQMPPSATINSVWLFPQSEQHHSNTACFRRTCKNGIFLCKLFNHLGIFG